MRTKAIPDQLVDAPRLLHDEVIGDQAPVAAPGNGLGAHHRGARPPRQAEQEAKERGIEVIALEVAGNNRRARDLFKDLGYETVRRTMQKRLRGH